MKLIAIGEAMAEIKFSSAGNFSLSFAGDTYNTSVYATREFRQRKSVAYITRVGVDPLSQSLITQFDEQGVDISQVASDPSQGCSTSASTRCRQTTVASEVSTTGAQTQPRAGCSPPTRQPPTFLLPG